MKFYTLILFSDHFLKLIRQIKFYTVIFLRGVIDFFIFKRRANVNSCFIDERFLFENGYLFISWEVKNLLWVRINNTMVTTSRKGIIVDYKKVGPEIDIEFKGLRNSVFVTKELRAKNKIISSSFTPPVTNIGINGMDIENVFFKHNRIRYTQKYNIKLPDVKISLTQFKKEDYL